MRFKTDNHLTSVHYLNNRLGFASSIISKILGSESFARWLVSLALALALELELALALELALVLELALDIEHYHITASVNDLTCPLPPHQSVI